MNKIDEADILHGDENLSSYEDVKMIVKLVNACIEYDAENPMNAIKTKEVKQ